MESRLLLDVVIIQIVAISLRREIPGDVMPTAEGEEWDEVERRSGFLPGDGN